MSRLPTVGGDAGNWGEVLNDYLSQSHQSDGKLRADVATIAALKALDVSTLPDKMQVMVGGYYSHGDGGGGQFYYDQTASETDNGGTIIAPTAGSGRWKRIYSASAVVRPEHFGAHGGGADDTVALVALAQATNAGITPKRIEISGTHKTTKTIQFTLADLVIQGSGKIIKGGAISQTTPTSYSDTDNYSAASLITLAGTGQKITGITLSDENQVDGQTNGYGRALAVCASDCIVSGITVTDFVQAIEVGWNEQKGFGTYAGNEIHRVRISGNIVKNCRPHHASQSAVGSGVRAYSSDVIIESNLVHCDDSFGTNLYMLHGIKIEALNDRHNLDSAINDYAGIIKNNIVIGPFRQCIYVESIDKIIISSNIVRKTGREAISFQGANTVVEGNLVDVGGYQDSNQAIGIISNHGKNWIIKDNVIRSWRNVSSSPTGHYGIRIESTSGHGIISGNIITRNASVVSKYQVSSPSGSLTTGTTQLISGTTGDVFRYVDGLVGDILTLGQGSGWFDTGEVITQATSGWSATIAAWSDPVDTALERGIDCPGRNITISSNRIDRGAAQTGIYLRYGTNLRVTNNLIRGYTVSGIMIQDYNGDLVIDGNEIGEALVASGYGVYAFAFSTEASVISIRNNKFSRNATALRFGNFTVSTAKVIVEGNDFVANTATLNNPRLGVVLYRNNTGYKTRYRGQSTISSGQTTAVVAHGLVGTPARINLTARGNVGALWSTTIGGTNMTINCASAPVSDTLIDWDAEVSQPDI